MDDSSFRLRSRLLVVVGITAAGCSGGKSSDDSGCNPARTTTIDLSELSDTGNSGTVDACPTEEGPGLIEILEADEDVEVVVRVGVLGSGVHVHHLLAVDLLLRATWLRRNP